LHCYKEYWQVILINNGDTPLRGHPVYPGWVYCAYPYGHGDTESISVRLLRSLFAPTFPERISVFKTIFFVIYTLEENTTNKMESEMRTVQSKPYNIIVFKTIFIFVIILSKNIQLTKWIPRCDTHRDEKWVTLWEMTTKPYNIFIFKTILFCIYTLQENTTNKSDCFLRTYFMTASRFINVIL
jgi:hypothetical protein